MNTHKVRGRAKLILEAYGRTEGENLALRRAAVARGDGREFWMAVYEMLDDGWCGECGERWPCSDSKRVDIRPALRARHHRKSGG